MQLRQPRRPSLDLCHIHLISHTRNNFSESQSHTDDTRSTFKLTAAVVLAADGTVLVEVARPGVGTVHEQVRLRVGDQISPPFSWATVGVDSIEAVAAEGGLELAGLHHDSGRHVATLRPTEGRP